MSGSGREALPKVREAFPEVREGSEGPPGSLGRVMRTFQKFGVVGSPSRKSGSGREALPNIRK